MLICFLTGWLIAVYLRLHGHNCATFYLRRQEGQKVIISPTTVAFLSLTCLGNLGKAHEFGADPELQPHLAF